MPRNNRGRRTVVVRNFGVGITDYRRAAMRAFVAYGTNGGVSLTEPAPPNSVVDVTGDTVVDVTGDTVVEPS